MNIITRPRPVYFAFKIKDGIFLGDANSPNQTDFLLSNKISTIINCASLQVPIAHNNPTISVLAFDWEDNQQTVILDYKNAAFQSIYNTIEKAQRSMEGILVCSLRGQSRALTVISAYLIQKYRWSLYKTLEYLNNKRQDFEIRANFLKQLVAFEQRLFGSQLKNCTNDWDEAELLEEGETIKNTFLNSLRCAPPAKARPVSSKLAESKPYFKGKKSVKFQQFVIIINPRILTYDEEEESEPEPPTPIPQSLLNINEHTKQQPKSQIQQPEPSLPKNVIKSTPPKAKHYKNDNYMSDLPRKSEPKKDPNSRIIRPKNTTNTTHFRSKTEIDQDVRILLTDYTRSNTKSEKRTPTPYRVRRSSQERLTGVQNSSQTVLKTEPTPDDYRLNINLNINAINFINLKQKLPAKAGSNLLFQSMPSDKKQSSSLKQSFIFNSEKLKMYLNQGLSRPSQANNPLMSTVANRFRRRASSSQTLPSQNPPFKDHSLKPIRLKKAPEEQILQVGARRWSVASPEPEKMRKHSTKDRGSNRN